jgi:hypothetical protein
MRGKERSLLEMAALAYGTALSLALVILLITTESGASAWFFGGAPIVVSMIAVTTRARQIVWTAFGACLAMGIICIFSIGLFVIQIGICLFLWWLLSSRRVGRQAFSLNDLFWLAAGLNVVVLPLFVN